MGMAVSVQESHWFRDDDGTESGATFLGSQDAGLTRGVGTVNKFRVRFRAAETAGGTFVLNARLQKQGPGDGSFVDVTTDTSTHVRLVTSDESMTDDEVTTEQMAGGSGTFGAGRYDEDNTDATGVSLDADINDYTEIEFCLYILDAGTSDSDTIDFQLSDAGVALDSYSTTATVTVSKVVTANITAVQTLPTFGQVGTVKQETGLASVQTLATFGQVANVTHETSLASVQTLAAFGQVANVTHETSLASVQTLATFGQVGAVKQETGLASVQTLAAFGQVATVAVDVQLVGAQTLSTFGQIGSITEPTSEANIAAVQTCAPFGQVAALIQHGANYWDDSEVSGDGGDPLNWSLGHVPDVGCIAIWDNTSDNNCLFTEAIVCDEVSVVVAYDGDIDVATYNITTSGNMTLAGTSIFDMGTGAFSCGGNWDSSAQGTTTASSSIVTMTTNGSTVTTKDFNFSEGINLTCDADVTLEGDGYILDLVVNGGKTVTRAAGQQRQNGDITNSGTITGGGQLTCAAISGTTTITPGTWTITTAFFNRTIQLNAGTYDSNVTFAPNFGSGMTLLGACVFGGTVAINFAGTGTTPFDTGSFTHTFEGATTIDANGAGTFTMDNSNGSVLVFEGGLTLTETSGTLIWSRGTGTMTFTGTTDPQTVDLLGKAVEAVEIDKASGVFTLAGVMDTVSLTITNGEFNSGGYDISTDGDFIVSAGAVMGAGSLGSQAIAVGSDLSLTGTSPASRLSMDGVTVYTLVVTGIIATATNVSFTNCNAAGGTAIDARFGCLDGGGNTNIYFGDITAAVQKLATFGQVATIGQETGLASVQTLATFGQVGAVKQETGLASVQTLAAFGQVATVAVDVQLVGVQTLATFGQVATVAVDVQLVGVQALATFGQVADIGAVAISDIAAVQTLAPFGQVATVAVDVQLVGVQTLATFGQVANVTHETSLASVQTLAAFGQVANVTHETSLASVQTLATFGQVGAVKQETGLASVQTLAAFGQVATVAVDVQLVGVQTLPTFGQVATIGQAEREIAAVQTLAPFGQVGAVKQETNVVSSQKLAAFGQSATVAVDVEVVGNQSLLGFVQSAVIEVDVVLVGVQSLSPFRQKARGEVFVAGRAARALAYDRRRRL